MSIVIDPQAHGWFDDNTESGGVRTLPVISNLVAMPFRKYDFENPSSNAGWQEGAAAGANSDGSCTAIYFTVATMSGTPPTSGVNKIRHKFYGRIYGIRYDPLYAYSGGPLVDFCIMVDGVAYRIHKSLYDWDTGVLIANPGERWFVIPNLLPDGEHSADIIAIGSQSANIGQMIFGYLVEQRAGYVSPGRTVYIQPQGTVPLTATGLTWSANQSRYGKYLYKIVYWSSDAAIRTITLSQAGTTCDVLAIPAGGRIEWPTHNVGPMAVDDALFKHLVDSGTTVTATAWFQG